MMELVILFMLLLAMLGLTCDKDTWPLFLFACIVGLVILVGSSSVPYYNSSVKDACSYNSFVDNVQPLQLTDGRTLFNVTCFNLSGMSRYNVYDYNKSWRYDPQYWGKEE